MRLYPIQSTNVPENPDPIQSKPIQTMDGSNPKCQPHFYVLRQDWIQFFLRFISKTQYGSFAIFRRHPISFPFIFKPNKYSFSE